MTKGDFFGVNVGKYSSTMVRVWINKWSDVVGGSTAIQMPDSLSQSASNLVGWFAPAKLRINMFYSFFGGLEQVLLVQLFTETGWWNKVYSFFIITFYDWHEQSWNRHLIFFRISSLLLGMKRLKSIEKSVKFSVSPSALGARELSGCRIGWIPASCCVASQAPGRGPEEETMFPGAEGMRSSYRESDRPFLSWKKDFISPNIWNKTFGAWVVFDWIKSWDPRFERRGLEPMIPARIREQLHIRKSERCPKDGIWDGFSSDDKIYVPCLDPSHLSRATQKCRWQLCGSFFLTGSCFCQSQYGWNGVKAI